MLSHIQNNKAFFQQARTFFSYLKKILKGLVHDEQTIIAKS